LSRKERTRAREFALQALYQADLTGDECLDAIEATLRADGHPAEVVDYAFLLARGVRERLAEIDALLAAAAQHWSVHRMAVVDRNVLRMGIEELTRHPAVPPRVVINEAIELAKRFSTSSSGAFVNGVLDRVRRDLEAAGRIAPSPPAPAAPAGQA
jgi:transcription antitermination factor NusB